MKKYVALALAALLALALFAGCSTGSSGKANYAPEPGYYDSDESFNRNADNMPVSTNAPSSSEDGSGLPVGRKIIRNASLDVEALEFDAFMSAVLAKTNELGGYVESNTVNNRKGSAKDLRYAMMVLRVPAERLDEFLSAVNGVGNVVESSEKVNDVTDSYVDTEARLASLRTEYETLLGLLERAESLEDIITLQDRLSDVRYQIESYEARIRSYDSLIAYSTVNITVNEVERETAVEKEGFGKEVSRRFRESLEDVGEGFRDFASWIIGDLPVITVWLFFIVGVPLIVFLIIRGAVRRRRKKKAAEENK